MARSAETTARAPVPERPTLPRLREASAGCRACPLWAGATQTVFGEGPARARVMLVGEQPGDREDREGHPFVGPAGALLDRALEEAGVERDDAYVTNVVKHFKFKLRGKRRIHQKPAAEEIAACRPWLDAELAVVRPEVLVCLGATAAKAIFGPSFRITKQRGILYPRTAREPDPALVQAGWMMATIHPSAVLRAPDRSVAYDSLVHDLRVAAEALVPG